MATIVYASSDFENPHYEKIENGRVKLPALSGSFENKFKQVYSKYILVKPVSISPGFSSCYIFEDADENLYGLPSYKGAPPCKTCPTLAHEPLSDQKIKYTDKILYCPDHFIVLDSLTYELYCCLILNVHKDISPLTKTILCFINKETLPSELVCCKRAALNYLSKWN